MVKRHFRIRHFTKGLIDLYYAERKTWFGWLPFVCHHDGTFYGAIIAEPESFKSVCENSIDNMRKSLGLCKDEISVEYVG